MGRRRSFGSAPLRRPRSFSRGFFVSVTRATLSSSDESSEESEDDEEEDELLLDRQTGRLAQGTCEYNGEKPVLYLDDEELELLVLESESLSLRIVRVTKHVDEVK